PLSVCLSLLFRFSLPAPSELYPLSLHDALPILGLGQVNNLLFCMILQDPQLAASLGFGNDLLQAVNQQLAAASPAMVYLGILERSEEHTSELQSRFDLVCRLLLEKKKIHDITSI